MPAPTEYSSLQDWLSWQESLHFSAIDLGLERVASVADRLGIRHPPFPVITVAGTNGKGSTCAFLTAMLQAAGYKVGTYTSPHILHYNERITLNSQPVADEPICAAFAEIDAARAEISLTYFEFGTLAAMLVFRQAAVDVVVLEVGLGGRLDATNVWDADVGIITAIGIDHVEWLGDNRLAIAREKAGIARSGQVLVCGDPDPPLSIAQRAQEVGAQLWQLGSDFKLQVQASGRFDLTLCTSNQSAQWCDLPAPALLGAVQYHNAACALLALHALESRLMRLNSACYIQGIEQARVVGRLQCLQSCPEIWVDVAHNPHAAENLAKWLENRPITGQTHVIFSILADKDMAGVVRPWLAGVNPWHVVAVISPRATSLDTMAASLASLGASYQVYPDLRRAWDQVIGTVQPEDRVVVFGSFLVVSSLLQGIAQHDFVLNPPPSA